MRTVSGRLTGMKLTLELVVVPQCIFNNTQRLLVELASEVASAFSAHTHEENCISQV